MNKINYVNEYLKNKFGERTLKICIDGGFTCPNRDGSKSNNGCIFCSERGSGEHLSYCASIKEQVQKAFSSIKIQRANLFILYFQNFTNTYDTVDNLKKKYDEAIDAFNECANNMATDGRRYDKNDEHIKKLVGLQIATRPDCITEEIAKLLESYSNKLYVAVELGIQTVNDDEANFLNRCYTSKDFENAVIILRKYNIDVIAHIMVGLPTPTGIETHEDIVKTVDFLNTQDIQGLKIHSCYVVKNTYLEKLYSEKRYVPISLETYLDELKYILNNISKDVVIHRISGDAPKDLLVAPDWNAHKKLVINQIL
jgi:radical SAM superfamily enzyme